MKKKPNWKFVAVFAIPGMVTIPQWGLEHRMLTATARRLYIALCWSTAYDPDAQAWELSLEMMGPGSWASAKRAFRDLLMLGLIEKHGSDMYRIVQDAPSRRLTEK